MYETHIDVAKEKMQKTIAVVKKDLATMRAGRANPQILDTITSINEFWQKDITALSLVLPIGISFFTFQQIGYLVDTYRGETTENTILDYLLYVTFFPKILMGPITKQ